MNGNRQKGTETERNGQKQQKGTETDGHKLKPKEMDRS